MHILLIEDEVGASELLADRLNGAGFRSTRVGSYEAALDCHLNLQSSAVVIDQSGAAMRPVQWIQPLREGGLEQPLLVLSPRSDWRDKVEALDAGADDYVMKPVRSEEVAARLRAMVRRSAGRSGNNIVIDGIDLDLKANCAWRDGQCLNLTRNEFRLLRLLMMSNRQVVSRETLCSALSGGPNELSENAIEVQVGRLRRKIGDDRIKTVRGLGYRLERSSSEAEAPAERGRCCGEAECTH